ncbi:Queuosine synthesis [Methanothermus fervidus DSM 2088]|uniref:Queuosine synthesis n=1 Tax=Methanothermus fervidus (strain ATCC 43054 / DSM 2088 / JCM 10308 / V24 S) TaxID=523846 RepID=E3GXE0_METFV|nr:asparagine synthase-related protein [Methanothermus fervidus]ADP76972.1 Queuosine synthesis [Methanothermus fervidus DSM 2088]
MKACVLFSGGKDSSLMATILDRLGMDVELVTVNFGIYDSWKAAAESAKALDFEHKVLKLNKKIIIKAVEKILEDGFPNNGINYLHKKVVEKVAKKYPVVADGTRRDDRVPKLNIDEIRSLEDKNDIEYITLRGMGHKTINRLSARLFKLRKIDSKLMKTSDYEVEIRYLIKKIGEKPESYFPPSHYQTQVIGWK